MKKLIVVALAALALAACSTELPDKAKPTARPTAPTVIIPKVVYAKSLNAKQARAFDETWRAVKEYVAKGDVTSALKALQVANGPGGSKGCETILFGIKFIPSSKASVNEAAAYILSRSTAAREAGSARIETANVDFPPIVEPAYKGTYPNGKPYLKVTPQKAAIGLAMRCKAGA